LTTLDMLLEEIRTGPSGARIAAFFDFDGTLIDGYSAAALYSHRPPVGAAAPTGQRGVRLGEMFATALKLARHRGLVVSDNPTLDKRRRDFADELREVRRYIAEIAGIASS
jgi:phosphoglycolate phosphatase-like HAD superfamily hydrolase